MQNKIVRQIVDDYKMLRSSNKVLCEHIRSLSKSKVKQIEEIKELNKQVYKLQDELTDERIVHNNILDLYREEIEELQKKIKEKEQEYQCLSLDGQKHR